MDEKSRQLSKRITRHKFKQDEDLMLKTLVQIYGNQNWVKIASFMDGRNARQCRDRWNHYISQDRESKEWTSYEDSMLLECVKLFGANWSRIALSFVNRSNLDIKNRYKHILKEMSKKKMAWSQSYESLSKSFFKERKHPNNSKVDDTFQNGQSRGDKNETIFFEEEFKFE